MNQELRTKVRIILKLVAILILTVLLVWLIDTDENKLQKKQPTGEQVRIEEAKVQQVTWVITNAYIMEQSENHLFIFYKGREMNYEYIQTQAETIDLTGHICDISFRAGKILNIKPKTEKISGKLLSVSDKKLEIEGKGSYEFSDKCSGYQIFEEMRMAELQELAIGYEYTDFILEDGKICAFLISRKEAMENIRVVIKNSGFASPYHEEIKLSSQEEMTISYGEYGQRQEGIIAPNETLTITAGCDYLDGARIELKTNLNTGKIQVPSIERNQGTPSYRGQLEIIETEHGLALINELLLEEYLYSVVPSEMPASYPTESLKAQAICARTYAYRYLQHPGYGELGAHVDDSVSFQVYNNIKENVNSTKAVCETTGMLLLYEENPADTYYYSTSCGYGSDAGLWNAKRQAETPFIKARHICTDETSESDSFEGAAELMKEENFEEYITSTDESAYEKEEPWYRWTYEVDEIDYNRLYESLLARFQATPEKILTYTGNDEPEEDAKSFESIKPIKFKKIHELKCLKRRAGGVMDELLIVTNQGIYKVISEYNIRAILNQGGEVIRQDGTEVTNGTLLPSTYLVIEPINLGKNMIGYKLIGGGYGHGAGMSQNGARAMGLNNKNCEEILLFFFEDCQVQKLY